MMFALFLTWYKRECFLWEKVTVISYLLSFLIFIKQFALSPLFVEKWLMLIWNIEIMYECIELFLLKRSTQTCGSLSAPSIHNHLEAYSFTPCRQCCSIVIKAGKSGKHMNRLEMVLRTWSFCMIVKYSDCDVTDLIIMMLLSVWENSIREGVFQPENVATILNFICL